MARGINTINGIDYVYEYKSHWNAELRRSEQKRDYIGKIKDGVFIPNKIYKMRMELEALKRQNGLPSVTDEKPLEEELEELIRKHNEHRSRLQEKRVEKAVSPIEPEPAAEPEPIVVAEPAPEIIPSPAVKEPRLEEASVEKPAAKVKKHVLRVGELDDEEFGPDLFTVQPSVAPVEDEPEEIPVVEEEAEEDEDPDLFAFAEDVEKFVYDDTLVDEPAAVEAIEEKPEVEEAEPVQEEPAKSLKKARKNKKEKKEEDNGQLFLF